MSRAANETLNLQVAPHFQNVCTFEEILIFIEGVAKCHKTLNNLVFMTIDTGGYSL